MTGEGALQPLRIHSLRVGAFIAATLIVVVLIWFAWRMPRAPQRATFFVFGGLTAVEVRDVDAQTANAAFVAIDDQLRRDERAWHPWQQPSALMDLNAAIAQEKSFRAPPELAGLIRAAQQGFRDSDGLFDPAIGAIITAWGFHTSRFPVVTPQPDLARIALLNARHPGMNNIHVAADGTVTSDNREIALDLDGLAEGYAAEQIAAILRAHQIDNAIINIGGDVLALGDADGRPWRVAIQDPHGDDNAADSPPAFAVAQLSGHEALFTSGDYHKYRNVHGQRWAHVIDPRTGLPKVNIGATAVIMDNATRADIASTALMVAGPQDFARIARGLHANCALLLTDDDHLYVTVSMQKRITLLRKSKTVTVVGAKTQRCD